MAVPEVLFVKPSIILMCLPLYYQLSQLADTRFGLNYQLMCLYVQRSVKQPTSLCSHQKILQIEGEENLIYMMRIPNSGTAVG